ncbi:MAG: hypothetical protein AB2A00_13380 [Myxococcota bacterium]
MKLLLTTTTAMLLAAACNVLLPGQCRTTDAPAKHCAPPTALAGTALTLQVQHGCLGCGVSEFACAAKVDGNRVDLHATQEECGQAPGTACPAICEIRNAPCNVPALAEGDYVVTVNGGDALNMAVRSSGEVSCNVDGFSVDGGR